MNKQDISLVDIISGKDSANRKLHKIKQIDFLMIPVKPSLFSNFTKTPFTCNNPLISRLEVEGIFANKIAP